MILLGPPIGGQRFTKYIYIVLIKFTRQFDFIANANVLKSDLHNSLTDKIIILKVDFHN